MRGKSAVLRGKVFAVIAITLVLSGCSLLLPKPQETETETEATTTFETTFATAESIVVSDGENVDLTEMFHSPNFRKAIRANLGLAENDPIMSEAVAAAKTLDVSDSEISNLTGLEYFTSLEELNCRRNVLKSLPKLPETLLILNCEQNFLISLPTLPEKISEIYCDDNYLTSIPELPDSLTLLRCEFNVLTSLPPIPDGVIDLCCRFNNIDPELVLFKDGTKVADKSDYDHITGQHFQYVLYTPPHAPPVKNPDDIP
jgi:Leucine-rich repeat (LRR) protein